MNATLLATIAGVILSLALAYIPGLATWYRSKDSTEQAGIMAILLVVSAAGAFGLACLGWAVQIGLSLSCDQPSAVNLIAALVAALVANQSTYSLGVRPFNTAYKTRMGLLPVSRKK